MTTFITIQPIYLAITAVILAGLASMTACILRCVPVTARFISFSMFAISGVAATCAGITTLLLRQVPSGQSMYHLQFDALAAFFFTIVGIVVFSCAVYGYGYMRSYEKQHSIAGMTFFTGLFIAGMYLVLLASNVFTFMLAWELMSITSYFLVVYHHESAANRRAAFIYLLMAHASGLLILLSYGVLLQFIAPATNSVGGVLNLTTFTITNAAFDFAAISAATAAHLPPAGVINAAFLLALLGFGMKAGIVPLHVWLPRAHPVAPSHISALMSGVMLKVAIYGFLRFCCTLLHADSWCWQWGVLLLGLGALSALVGILHALMQTDLKKLLAYSSVENVGLIFAGIGLSMIFFSSNHLVLGTLGFIAVLYHCLNHAVFKSLLFLGAGAILQHSHEHDLEKMGGLIHNMPQTALFFLIGCLSIAALPPLNGFVSEWLILQTTLHAAMLPTMWMQSGVLRILITLAAALIALTGALVATCFVKVYGVAFLGQARTRHVRHAKDPHFCMRLALGVLALLCIACGLLAPFVVKALNTIPHQLFGVGLQLGNTDGAIVGNANASTNISNNWLWLAPLTVTAATVSQQSAYSALLIGLGILIVSMFGYWLIRLCYKHTCIVKVKPWECGFGGVTARMQISATAFAMLLRRVFSGMWSLIEKVEKEQMVEGTEKIGIVKLGLNDSAPECITYSLQIGDWIWQYGYVPLERGIAFITRYAARIQSGNIRVYLAYTFATLILLLWLIA